MHLLGAKNSAGYLNAKITKIAPAPKECLGVINSLGKEARELPGGGDV